jgi:hypothetical protein
MLARNKSSASFNSFSEGGSNSSRRRDDVTANENFKVVIRVRPPLPRELHSDQGMVNIIKVDDSKAITISENLAVDMNRKTKISIILIMLEKMNQGKKNGDPSTDGMIYSSHTFTFDHVYDQRSKQAEVYNTTARDAVHSVLAGYNATIIAYGQTGTGKTYTMEGQNGFTNNEERGVIPRATEDIFNCKSY